MAQGARPFFPENIMFSEAGTFNTDPPTEWVEYSRAGSDVRVSLPYNPKWGTEKYAMKSAYWESPYDNLIQFGPMLGCEGGGVCQWDSMKFIEGMDADATVERIKSERDTYDMAELPEPVVLQVAGHTVVRYGDPGFCAYDVWEVVGTTSNIRFSFCDRTTVPGWTTEALMERIVGTLRM
jgi:hypothetical protein